MLQHAEAIRERKQSTAKGRLQQAALHDVGVGVRRKSLGRRLRRRTTGRAQRVRRRGRPQSRQNGLRRTRHRAPTDLTGPILLSSPSHNQSVRASRRWRRTVELGRAELVHCIPNESVYTWPSTKRGISAARFYTHDRTIRRLVCPRECDRPGGVKTSRPRGDPDSQGRPKLRGVFRAWLREVITTIVRCFGCSSGGISDQAFKGLTA